MITLSRSIHPRRVLKQHGPYLWLVLVLALTAFFAYRNTAEIERIATLISTADRSNMGTIAAIEIGVLALVALTYRSLLSNLGHRIRFRSLVGVHLQRVVVGTISPFGGPSSMAIFVHAMRQRNVRTADALLAITIKSVIGNVAFLLLLVPVLFVQEPSTALILASIGLVLLVAFSCSCLAFALRQSKPPALLIRMLPRKGLRLLAQSRRHRVEFASLLEPFAYLLTTKLAGVLILDMSLRAVGYPADFKTVLVAYMVGMVFLMVAPVFQGIGFVEVGMTIALERHGIPGSAAIGATLLTRVAELWLPLIAGLVYQALTTARQSRGGMAAAPA